MKFFSFIFFSYWISISSLFSQINHQKGDVFTAGAAYSNIADEGVHALFRNPAFLHKTQRKYTALTTIENRFGWNTLQRYSGALVLSKEKTGYGIGFQQFGDNAYHEQTLTYAMSHEIENVAIGIQASWVHIGIKGLPSKDTYTVSLGGNFQLSEKWLLGSYLHNISRSSIPNENIERLPSFIEIGTKYTLNEKSFFTFLLNTDTSINPNYRVGLHYLPHKKIVAKIGFESIPSSFYTGITLKHETLALGYTVYTHPYLPLSHLLGVKFEFGKEKTRKKN